MPTETPPEHHSTKKIGKSMAIIAWIIGILMATQFFGAWEENQINPNRSPASLVGKEGQVTVTLKQSRGGHYVTSGRINGKPVTFMLDTGATDVVIPEALATQIGLPRIGRNNVSTANGIIEVYGTIVESLQFGEIKLNGVRASINPHMSGNNKILLGMSALKQLDFQQQNGELKITQNR